MFSISLKLNRRHSPQFLCPHVRPSSYTEIHGPICFNPWCQAAVTAFLLSHVLRMSILFTSPALLHSYTSCVSILNQMILFFPCSHYMCHFSVHSVFLHLLGIRLISYLSFVFPEHLAFLYLFEYCTSLNIGHSTLECATLKI